MWSKTKKHDPELINLAPNPGFEEKDLSCYSTNHGNVTFELTNDCHSGNYAAHISGRSVYWHGLYFDPKLEKGKTYHLSFWMKTDGEALVGAQIREDGIEAEFIGETIGNEWTQVKGSFTVGEQTNAVRIIFQSTYLSQVKDGDIYVDDIILVEKNN